MAKRKKKTLGQKVKEKLHIGDSPDSDADTVNPENDEVEDWEDEPAPSEDEPTGDDPEPAKPEKKARVKKKSASDGAPRKATVTSVPGNQRKFLK